MHGRAGQTVAAEWLPPLRIRSGNLEGMDGQALGEDVVEEFGRLQKQYPITALLIAFTLGYVVGRARS